MDASSWLISTGFHRVLMQSAVPCCLSEATRPQGKAVEDDPIILVNPAFCTLVGYGAEELIGRNCRFMQGANRQQASRRRIRHALVNGILTQVIVTNYHRSGVSFENLLTLIPIRTSDRVVRFFVGASFVIPETDKLEAYREQSRSLRSFVSDLDGMLPAEDWQRIDGAEILDGDPRRLLAARIDAIAAPTNL